LIARSELGFAHDIPLSPHDPTPSDPHGMRRLDRQLCFTLYSSSLVMTKLYKPPSHHEARQVLYTAHATSTGGREGTSRSSDGVLDLKLTTPKEMGGNGAVGTNPEQLFAAGYSACFIGAMKFVAMTRKIALPAEVGIGPIPAGFGSRSRRTSPLQGWRTTPPRRSSRPRTRSAPTRTRPAATSR
jgi:hypothetical protein